MVLMQLYSHKWLPVVHSLISIAKERKKKIKYRKVLTHLKMVNF